MTNEDPGRMARDVEQVAQALRELELQGRESAQAVDEAFSVAGERLARALGRAVSDGKLSLRELASAVLEAINAAGGQSGRGGLSDVFGAIFQQAFSGARADGGPVLRGGAYLVGERGPEVFRPASSGAVEPLSGGAQVNVTLNLTSGADVVRSEAQVAAALQRALRMGVR